MTAHLTSIWSRLTAVIILMLSGGCRASPAHHAAGAASSEKAVLWTMRSAEYRAATTGVFAAAAAALPALLADETWTAALEQDTAAAQGKPPAVIVDIDETMLHNSQYQWELVATGDSYSAASWDAWIERAEAQAVAGAVGYVKRVLAMNATIFYVTNRSCRSRSASGTCPQAADTVRNLVAVGFPEPRAEQLLLRGMRRDWSSDKSSRRSYIAANYRIVQMVGDDLADFIAAARDASEERRNQLMAMHRSRWGIAWFLVPNPMYGSWEHARAP